MSVAVRFVSASKSNVLQQSNTNVVVPVPLDAVKAVKEDETTLKRKRRLSRENENCMDGAGKVRRGQRFQSSSQRGGGGLQRPASSDETGEEEEEDDEVRYCRGRGRSQPRPIIPNYVTKSDTGQYRRRKAASRCDPAKAHLSVSIAKRNARERNRVKLVNQGFATLRSRIPDYISEMYTEERKKKKVSKVETLRMALGYIRHLTDMLDLRGEEDWSVGEGAGYEDDGGVGLEEEGEDVGDEIGESLMLSESSFSVDVGCCYDLEKTDGEVIPKDGKLPSITESFPRKSIRLLYETPAFLSDTSAFHV